MTFEMEPPDEPCPDCGSTHHRACGHTLPPQGAAPLREWPDGAEIHNRFCGENGQLCQACQIRREEPAVPPVPAETKGTCQNGGYWSEITPHQKTPECVGWKLSPVPAEPGSAEQLTTAVNELLRELNKRVFNDAIDITKLHVAVGLCEDFAEAHATILHKFSENAVDLASSRKVKIDSLEAALLSAQKEIALWRGIVEELDPIHVQPPYDHDGECSYCRTKEGRKHPRACTWERARAALAQGKP
jgi:hypothetical protein